MGSIVSFITNRNLLVKDTIFVSIVDPGVGSKRRSVAVLTEDGHYIITPDNGTLTHIAHYGTIKEVRLIDEEKNRLPKSGASHTFHYRDIFAYTAARLAAGVINFEDIYQQLPQTPLFL